MNSFLARWSFSTLHHAGTSASLSTPSAALTTHGPFAWSRNPIYLAMTCLYMGAGLLGGSWWPSILLPMLLLTMNRAVIAHEGRYLQQAFGSAYADYIQRVRRWL